MSVLRTVRRTAPPSGAVVGESALGAVLGLLGNGAETAVFFGLLVVDEDLTVLAVAARRIPRSAHQAEHRIRVEEDAIHLLEGAVCGLREEEVYHGHDEGVAKQGVSTGRSGMCI